MQQLVNEFLATSISKLNARANYHSQELMRLQAQLSTITNKIQ